MKKYLIFGFKQLKLVRKLIGRKLVRRRPGVSLFMVLLFSFIAALVVAEMFVLLNWTQDSAAVVRWHFRDRAALASLIDVGRHWLRAELDAGTLPVIGSDEEAARPRSFSDVRLFHRAGESGAFLDIYNLDYIPDDVPDKGWDRDAGPESFFPPQKGAFLIRAFKPKDQGPTMVLDVVLNLRDLDEHLTGGRPLTFEPKPLLWQEVWF